MDILRQTFHLYQKMRKKIPHLLIPIPSWGRWGKYGFEYKNDQIVKITGSPSRRVRGYLVLSNYCIDNKRFRLGKLIFLQNFAALKRDKQIILKASLIILMVILFDLNRSHTLQDTLELIFRDGFII